MTNFLEIKYKKKKNNYWTKYNPNVRVYREVYSPYITKSRAGVKYTHYKKKFKLIK